MNLGIADPVLRYGPQRNKTNAKKKKSLVFKKLWICHRILI